MTSASVAAHQVDLVSSVKKGVASVVHSVTAVGRGKWTVEEDVTLARVR
jgi:hypothetical protein